MPIELAKHKHAYITCQTQTNRLIKIYIAPLQDPYSEALPIQAKRKRTVLRRWRNWYQAMLGRCLRSIGSSFQVVAATTKKNGFET